MRSLLVTVSSVSGVVCLGEERARRIPQEAHSEVELNATGSRLLFLDEDLLVDRLILPTMTIFTSPSNSATQNLRLPTIWPVVR